MLVQALNPLGNCCRPATRRVNDGHPIEEVGEKLGAMMPRIAKNKLVDMARNR